MWEKRYLELNEFANFLSEFFLLFLDVIDVGLFKEVTFFGERWDFSVDLYGVGIKDVFAFELFLLFFLAFVMGLWKIGKMLLLAF
jgi:hypothetical protein